MRSLETRRRSLHSALLLVALVAAVGQAQQIRNGTIRGTTTDSASGQPVAGALIQIRGDSVFRTQRSDDAGKFRFHLPLGTYRISVLRVGFSESQRNIVLSSRDTALNVPIRPVATALAETRIRGEVPAIYGVVARLPDLMPLAGVTIRVMGATQILTTDSTGKFFVDVGKPGTYFVRMTRDGFGEEWFPIEVPEKRAIEASRMLEPSTRKVAASREHLYKEADERLRYRHPMNSALVTGSELRDAGGDMLTGLQRSRSVVAKGLKVGGGGCIFVDGVWKGPNFRLEMIDPDEVAAVELYGARGDMTSTLRGLSNCADAQRRPGANVMTQSPGGAYGPIANRPEGVRKIVIWLKK